MSKPSKTSGAVVPALLASLLLSALAVAADDTRNPLDATSAARTAGSTESLYQVRCWQYGRLLFEVESLQGRHIRAEVARNVVNAGWNLSELRAVGLSLEDIFLQLTAAEKQEESKEPEGGKQ